MALISEIILEKFRWQIARNVFVVGHTWMNDKYLSEQKFIDLINSNIKSFETFKDFITTLNGQFSIVVKHEKEVWIVCSHTWSYPLFYKKEGDNLFVSDNPESLITKDIDRKTVPIIEQYFLNFGVTPGNATLSKTVSQLRPGEIIAIKERETESFSFVPIAKISGVRPKIPVSTKDLHQHFISTFKKYFEFLKDKQILLPLTAGYDSRLLACLLAEFGHKNVVCATWGRKDNIEKQTAEKVAKELGFKYVFVEYTKELISGFTKTKEFNEFVNFEGHWSSMPFLQDYFAIKELKQKNIIDDNTIVLPGHPGDFLKGSHLDISDLNATYNDLYEKINRNFCTTIPISAGKKKNLKKLFFAQFFSNDFSYPWQAFERWDFEERQCKFIANLSSGFTYFNIDFLMPLFDVDTIKFFQNVPVEQKIGETLYNETLEKYFFKKQNVDFDLKQLSGNKQIFPRIKNGIIKIVPKFIKDKYYPMDDIIFYREITAELLEANREFVYKHPTKPHFYNSYIIQWYLQHIKSAKHIDNK